MPLTRRQQIMKIYFQGRWPNNEAAGLNSSLKEMLEAMENNDFHGLTEIIRSTFLNFLDEWDFENKPLN
ncbi:MAG: hypothetical protein K6T80_04975 [Firmicutes bacterium]|nr:hypothetical protein [Bacillota bacterium]